jgi:hypothetical protein
LAYDIYPVRSFGITHHLATRAGVRAEEIFLLVQRVSFRLVVLLGVLSLPSSNEIFAILPVATISQRHPAHCVQLFLSISLSSDPLPPNEPSESLPKPSHPEAAFPSKNNQRIVQNRVPRGFLRSRPAGIPSQLRRSEERRGGEQGWGEEEKPGRSCRRTT